VHLLTLLVSAAVLVGIAFAAYQDFASLFRNNRQLRHYLTPFNYIQATNGYIQDHYFSGPVVISPLGEDAKRDAAGASTSARRYSCWWWAKPLVPIIFAQGYPRNTNPQAVGAAGLINLPNVHSCGRKLRSRCPACSPISAATITAATRRTLRKRAGCTQACRLQRDLAR
jgi:lipid A ethanolaminephosphotransferase